MAAVVVLVVDFLGGEEGGGKAMQDLGCGDRDGLILDG